MKDNLSSEEEQKEETEILSQFNAMLEAQVSSTIFNIDIYQLSGWRELIDE